MTFGIIFCGYQCADLLAESLTPWIEARRANLGGHKYVICAVCTPFIGFDHQFEPPDSTLSTLLAHRDRDEIDAVVEGEEPMSEIAARGAALAYLRDTARVDATWQVDADEVYTVAEIERIASYVVANPWVAWFRVSYRNAVFTKHQYLADPFTPPRIHRLHIQGILDAIGFEADNDVVYGRRDGILVSQHELSSMTIPKEIAFVRHDSWLSNERSKRKIAYQLRGRGWPECSFRWDDETNQLRFNEQYYARRGMPLPEVLTDGDGRTLDDCRRRFEGQLPLSEGAFPGIERKPFTP